MVEKNCASYKCISVVLVWFESRCQIKKMVLEFLFYFNLTSIQCLHCCIKCLQILQVKTLLQNVYCMYAHISAQCIVMHPRQSKFWTPDKVKGRKSSLFVSLWGICTEVNDTIWNLVKLVCLISLTFSIW